MTSPRWKRSWEVCWGWKSNRAWAWRGLCERTQIATCHMWNYTRSWTAAVCGTVYHRVSLTISVKKSSTVEYILTSTGQRFLFVRNTLVWDFRFFGLPCSINPHHVETERVVNDFADDSRIDSCSDNWIGWWLWQAWAWQWNQPSPHLNPCPCAVLSVWFVTQHETLCVIMCVLTKNKQTKEQTDLSCFLKKDFTTWMFLLKWYWNCTHSWDVYLSDCLAFFVGFGSAVSSFFCSVVRERKHWESKNTDPYWVFIVPQEHSSLLGNTVGPVEVHQLV